MIKHRLDPFSLVLGIASVAFGVMLLVGDPSPEDMRPGRWWPISLLIIGVMFAIAGVQRVMRQPASEEGLGDTEDDAGES